MDVIQLSNKLIYLKWHLYLCFRSFEKTLLQSLLVLELYHVHLRFMLSLYFGSHVTNFLRVLLDHVLFCSDQFAVLILLKHLDIVIHVFYKTTFMS